MLSVIFYLIIGPALLAFFLGFSAHGLKTMTASVEGDPSGPTNSSGEAPTEDQTASESPSEDTEPTPTAS